MAKNDKILLDGILDHRLQLRLPSDKRDEVFEYFAFEQILKDYDFSNDELMQGIVDGRNDGGIDGFYITVNGHLLADPLSFVWPKSGAMLEVWIITSKLHDTFKQAPVDNLVASVHELFDFAIASVDLKGDYSERIIQLRENLKYAYRKVSHSLNEFSITFCYASRGNVVELGESIQSRASQLVHIVNDAFGNCDCQFKFIGATELVELSRKVPNFTLELPIQKELSNSGNYVLLVRLIDYFNFIQDSGKLRRYLFDSNVRDFMGLNRVNQDIRATLSNVESPDFWWLNNGITILVTHAFIISDVIHLRDIQIVNGLQTSESIFRYFEGGKRDPNNRCLLIKVLVSDNEATRDTIIRATNNQTAVELASLHATDKIQKDIEDILRQNDYFYERRINFYKNQGIASDKIVTPLYMASAYLNLVLKNPTQASRLKSKFMKSSSSYARVFSTEDDLSIWPKIALILRKTDSFLESVRPVGRASENFLKRRRQILSFLTVAKILRTFNFSLGELLALDPLKFTIEELRLLWEPVDKLVAQSKGSIVKKGNFILLCKSLSQQFGITGIERLLNNRESIDDGESSEPEEPTARMKEPVTLEFAMKVHALLPSQPWKPGVHVEICEKLGCSRRDYFDAVKLLIEEGIRFRQKDGVVYDEDGNVIAFDNDRVNIGKLSSDNGFDGPAFKANP
ncbi:MAG TPA: AIPR family protein [Cyclobacteriaceae bacterium]|nr:AIPR family protein [Cyclobacteriaceae bacterium]